MDCTKIEKLLDGYLDRELDRHRVITVELHLEGCSECSRNFDARSSITSRIKKHATYYPAPGALANRIRAQIDETAPSRRAKTRPHRFRLPQWSRWLQLGGAVATAVVV